MQSALADAANDAVVEVQASGDALQLPQNLDLKAAAPLAAAFLERRGADIVVDAANVQRLGGQCLQVLLSARASWAEDDVVMTLEKPSPEFEAAMVLFGAGFGAPAA